MPALTAIFTANINPFRQNMQAAQSIANNSARAISHSYRGAFYEVLVLLREIGRGNWARVPGSLSLLLSRLGLLRLLLNPITAILAAIGAGFYRVFSLANQTAEAMANLSKAINGPTDNFINLAEAMEKAKRKARDFRAEMQELNRVAYGGKDQDHPATIEEAKARFEAAKAEKEAAFAAAEKHRREGTDLSPDQLQKRAKAAGEELAKAKDKFKEENEASRQGGWRDWFGVSLWHIAGASAAKEQMDKAQTAYDVAQAQANIAADKQGELDIKSKEADKAAERAAEEVRRFAEAPADSIENPNGPRIGHGYVNREQAVGAYAAPAVALLDTTKKMQRDIATIKGIMQHGAKDKLAGLGISGTKL